MVNFEVSCYYKDNVNKLIGAEVIVYEGSNAIDRIVITDNHGLEELRAKLENLSNEFVDCDDFIKALSENTFKGDNIVVNANLFDNKDSSEFATRDHTHNEYANYSHTNSNPVHGSASSTLWGHTRIRDDLTSKNLVIGESLSGRQGYELNQKILELNQKVTELENLNNELKTKYYRNTLQVKIGRHRDGVPDDGENGTKIELGSGRGAIYAQIYSEDPDFDYYNRTVIISINGKAYWKSTDANGKSGYLSINLSPGEYLVEAYTGFGDEFTAIQQKKLIVT